MSYTPYYPSTPPAPPPKPSNTSTPHRGPWLPPQPEPSELEGSQSQSPHPTSQQMHHLNSPPSIPPIEPGWLPLRVREKPTKDLHDLLRTPAMQTALLSDPRTTHPSLLTSALPLPALLKSNIILSTHLLSQESRLTSLREHTQARLLALRALEQAHRAKMGETEEALAQFGPRALYARLCGGVGEQELLVRGVEESWLEGEGEASGGEVEAWLRRVREGGKVGFLRRERRERWDEGRVGGWR